MNLRKILYILVSILTGLQLTAQIGINTESPLSIFHIDPKGDTSPSGSSGTDDDVIVTNDGRLGLGTVVPETGYKIDIRGNAIFSGDKTIENGNELIGGSAYVSSKVGLGTTTPKGALHIANTTDGYKFKISDTSEKEGYVLVSDDDGYAYWEGLRPMSSVVYGKLKPNVSISPLNTNVNITSKDLILSPGRWLIVAKAVTAGNLGGFYMYIKLYEKTSGSPISRGSTGAFSESAAANLCVSNLIAYVDVPKKAGTTSGDENYYTHFSKYMTKKVRF